METNRTTHSRLAVIMQAGGLIQHMEPAERLATARAGFANLAREGRVLLADLAKQIRETDCTNATALSVGRSAANHRADLNGVASQAYQLLNAAKGGALTDAQASKLDQLNQQATTLLATLRQELDDLWRARWENGPSDRDPNGGGAAAAIMVGVC